MRIENDAELDAYLKANPGLKVENAVILMGNNSTWASAEVRVPSPAKPHKYHAKPTEYNGRRYASKKEAEFARQLDLRQRAGEVAFWLRQVPFDLPDGTRYLLDFMVFACSPDHPPYSLGCFDYVEFLEVKGYKTREGERKRKWCEQTYAIQVTVV